MNKVGLKIALFINALVTTFLYGMIFVSAGFAQEHPSPDSTEIQRQVVELANRRFGFEPGMGCGADINRNGILRDIVGSQINQGLTSDDPIERANQFFERNQDLFQMQNSRSEMVARGLYRDPNRNGYVDFDQMVGGVKVYLGGYTVEFNSDSSSTTLTYIHAFGLGYIPEARDINPVPTIDSLEAGRIAQADPDNARFRTYTGNYELYVSSAYDGIHKFDDGRVHLIWMFGLGGSRLFDGTAIYIIDAHTGEILKRMSGSR
jgi:hypothetical protein